MPSNRMQYTIGINADTSQAKKSIQELQNALNEITTANSKKLGLDIDLNNAAKAAQQLQQSIQSAINVDTGRLNFTAFNKSLMQSNTNLNQLITQLRSTGGLGNQAVSQLARSLSTAEIPVKRMTGLLGNFATTLANSFKWQISSNIIHGMQSALSSAVGYAQDLNETLNNIRIVTGQSVDDMAKFAVSANQAAKELSTTTKEFANASLIYYQQGDSAELAAKKAATTVKAANVAFTASAKEMSEMLTAVWNSYQVGEDQLERTVDVMAKLGATTASSMEEMATAMQKVASTANTVGVSMQQMSAIVATSASVTRQAPETVGTAWNTILSRIGGLKLGETLEDGVDLNKYSNALRTVGVNILDATGNLRNMGGVIDELGAKWQTLNKGQKAALAQTIGGARQYTQIMAFFENFDKYQKNIITAQNSAGALQEQQEIYAQGWEAARDRSRAALEELWDVLIDDEAMIAFTNGMTKMTESVTGLVKAFGGLPGILATVSALMTKTFSNQIVAGVSKAAANVVGFGQAFTKQGNGQPMSGGYTLGQFLTGRMPNAEARQQISNLAVTRDVLLQTARTGVGLDKENPFYNQLRQSNGLQAGAYTAQIQAMRQGGNLTPIQMLNLTNLQQRAEHTQNAYNILDAFHEDTSAVSSNLINTNKGASNIFAGLSKAMYREELMKIQERATGAAGKELEAYKSQFADIAKKAHINDAVFGSYKPAENTTDSDSLARKFGSLEFKGLTEAERRQVIADTRQATAQSIQATRSQFNPNGQIDPASQFKAIGEAAKTAVTGITSGIAAFNQLNGAMAAFDAGNVTQGLMGIAAAATSVTQAFITGGLPGGLIALGTTAIGFLVNQYDASVEKLKEKAKETADDMNKTVSQHNESNTNITNAIKEYSNLNDVLHTGSINQSEYNESLLNVANSLEIQNASVLALSEQYSALDSQIQEAIKTQLEQQEIAAKVGLSQFDQNLTDLAYNQFKDNNAVHINRHLNTLDFIGLFGDDSLNETLQNYGFDDISKILGVEYGSLQLNEESLRQFVTGYNQIMETVSTLNIDDQNAFQEIKIVGEEVIPGILSLISSINPLYSSIYTNQAKEFLNEEQFTSAANYDSEQRHNLTNKFLDKLGISELDPVYEVAKSAFQQIIDTAVTGFVDGGNVKAELAAAADKVRTDWEQKAKKAGVSDPGKYISEKTQGWTEQQWLNNPGFAAIYAGQSGPSTKVATAFSVQDLLKFYFAGGKDFSFETLADKIFNDTNLSTLFLGKSGLSQIDFKQLNNHEKYQALLDFIQWLITFQDDVINMANEDITKQNSKREQLKKDLKKHFDSTIFEGTEYKTDTFDWDLLQGDIDSYQSILDQQNNGTKLNKAQQDSLKRVDILGGIQKAQQTLYLYQGGIDTQFEGFLSTVDQSVDNVINNIQTLMDMDLSSSKWGESLNDIIRLLENHGISFSEWLNMSDLEKSQFRLQALKSELQDLEELEASGQSIDENRKLQLYADIQAIEENVNNLELTNFKNQMQEITDEWDKMRKNAQSALSLISSNLKNLGNLSFSDLEELRQTLLDAGLEAEHVAQILDDMRHAGEKGASKEDIWAGVMASTTAALMSVTADMEQASGVEDLISKDVVKKIDLSLGENNEVQTFIDNLSPQSIVLEKSSESTLPETVEIDLNNINLAIAEGKIKEIKHDLENNELIITTVDDQEYVLKAKQWEFDFEKRELNVEMPEGEKITSTIDHWSLSLSGEKELKVKLKDETGETEEITEKVDNIVAKITNNDKGYTCQFVLKDQNNKDIATIADNFQMAFQKLEDTNEVVITFTNEHGEVITGTLPQEVADLLDKLPSNHEIQLSFLEPTKESQEILNDALKEKEKTIKIKYTDPSGNVYEWNTSKNSAPTMTPAFKNEATKFNDLLGITTPTLDKTTSTKNKRNQIALNDKQLSLITNTTKWLSSQEGGTFTPDILNKNTWGDISKQFSDLNELGRGAIGDLVFSLEDALKSENSTIQNAAKMVLDGLKQGLLLAGQKDDWNNYVNGLGDKIDAAFRLQLLIQSPSRLTMALAPYLIEGLQVGLTNAIAGWKPNVDGLDVKLTTAIKNSISKIKNPYEILKNQWIDDQKKAGNKQSDDDLSAMYDEQWQTKKQSWINAQKKANNYQATDDLSAIYDALQFGDVIHQQTQELAETEAKKILSGQGLSDNQKLAVLSAREMVDKVFDKDLNLLHGEELDEYWNLVQKYVDEYFEGLYNNSRSAEAEIKDIWVNAANLIYEYDEQKAQETYETWESTFNAIAKAREALLNGDSVLDAMLGDTDSLSYLLQYLMETKGMGYKQAQSFLNDSNADLSTLQFEAYQAAAQKELMSGKLSPFYNKDTGQIEVDQKYLGDEGFKNYQAEMVNRMRDVYNEGEEPFFKMLNELSVGNSNEQETAAMLIASMKAKNSEAVQFDDNGQYKLNDEIEFSDVLDDQMLIAAARKAGFTSAEEYKRALFSALAQDTNAQGMEANQIWEEQASLVDSNTKELKEYAQALLEVNGDTRKLNELSREEQKQMAGVAAKAKMAQEGWTSLATKQKDALKTIAKGQQNDLKYVNSLQSVANDVKKIFGNSKAATADFVKNHIKDIQKMANGDTKAAERVERALLESQASLEGWGKDLNGNGLQDELSGIIDQLNSFGDEYANMPIGFEVTANTDPALASLSGLLSSGQMTAEEIQRAFELIGWEPEIAYEPVEVTEQDKSRGYATATILGKTYSTTIDESVEVGSTVQVPYIKSAKKTGGGASGSKPPKSGGSGGGGGKQHEKKDPIRPQDEIERYHEIRDQIEKLGNALDKVDKIKTKTFGQKHLDALKEEIALLKQENGLQQEYYAEAARYLAADRADLMHYGAATFNADGTVNYEEYMQNIIAEVNRRFAASESDEEDEAAQQWYDDAKKALENYEEALDLVDTTQNDILDNLNEISALTLEAAQYRLEIRVDLNDSDIEILDYYISKWEKMLSQQDESMEASIGQVYAYEDSLSALGDTFSELIYAHNMGDLNDSDFVEGLKDVRDQVFDTLGSINDLQNTIAEWYGQTLDKAEEELDKYTNKLSHSRDVMQTYIEMQQLMGKGADYRALQNMYTFAYESSLENAKAAREYVDILKEAREVILQQVEEYGWTDTLKQQFDDVEAHIIEAENTLLENTQQTLEDAKAEFENTISAIIKELDNAFETFKDANGNLKTSFSEVADEYSYWTEEQGWYVSTAKELYEVSKINRKIEDSIAGATTQQSKERLKLLQDEINAYAEKNRLTEYDIKMNELQYEMALAMQGLEDAGNNKQTVRLTRDENGNYGYQYTADQDEMDAARQKYEDVLQQINELSDEYQKEMMQRWIDAEEEFRTKIEEILTDESHSMEERIERAKAFEQQHLEALQYYHDEYNKASEQLLTNQEYVQQHYGESIMQNTHMVQDQLNITVGKMINETDRYKTYINEQAFPQIEAAMEIYKGDLDATKDATKLSWEAMGKSVNDYRGINQLARQDIQNTDAVLRNTLSGISNATAKWLEHSNSLRTTITSYESLGNSINGIISKLNSATSAANTAASAIRNMQSASYSSYSGSRSSPSSSSPGGSSPGGAKSPTTVTTTPATSNSSSKGWVSRFTARTGTKVKATAFSTGGLDDVTGWHYLHGTLEKPELVLNADDTQNMLKMVNILHNLSPEMLSALHGTINGSAYTMLAGLGGAMSAHSINSTNSELNQNVEIHADFPNVTDKNEIVEAFDNLVNLATQYANRKG